MAKRASKSTPAKPPSRPAKGKAEGKFSSEGALTEAAVPEPDEAAAPLISEAAEESPPKVETPPAPPSGEPPGTFKDDGPTAATGQPADTEEEAVEEGTAGDGKTSLPQPEAAKLAFRATPGDAFEQNPLSAIRDAAPDGVVAGVFSASK